VWGIYPSGSVTPSSYPVIKAHKPQKDYLARNITSHIGSPQENLASLLNDLLKPYIESSPFYCKNSAQFVTKMKTLTLNPDDHVISFDVEALFPSVPIKDCIKMIKRTLEADPTLTNRTKLTPKDICDLLNLCWSSSDFIYNERHYTTKDSGPIGLSLMACISQQWMNHTMERAVAIAEERNISPPRHITIYMDDC
jgi:hypothetical protein